MPMQRERYPADWEAISQRVREQAGQRCQWCGAANHTWFLTRPDGTRGPIGEKGVGYWRKQAGYKVTRIVLTVAHLGTAHADGTPGDKHDKHDTRPENLAALCQRCHLNYDRADHLAHAAATRAAKRLARQPQLFAVGEPV